MKVFKIKLQYKAVREAEIEIEAESIIDAMDAIIKMKREDSLPKVDGFDVDPYIYSIERK